MLKYILCRTDSANRAAFSAGQEAWSEVSGIDGFCGQAGGWAQQDSTLAVILGLWHNQAAIDNFMATIHDDCFEKSGQRNLINQIDVSVWNRIDTEDKFTGIDEVNLHQGFLWISDCCLVPGESRRQHFLKMQKDVWNPSMAKSGVIARSAWANPIDPSRFLITSVWKSEEHIHNWTNGDFRKAWCEADIESDCESVKGKLVNLEYCWRVN